MKGRKWTGKTRAFAGLGLAILLFLGLTGMVRFPAIATVTSEKICLPDKGRTEDDYVQRTDCRGIPFIYRSCVTDWELRVAESAH